MFKNLTTDAVDGAYGALRILVTCMALALTVVACQGTAPTTNPVAGAIANDPGDPDGGGEVPTPRPTPTPTPTPSPTPTPPPPNQPPWLDDILVDGRSSRYGTPAARLGQEVELRARSGDPEGVRLSHKWIYGTEVYTMRAKTHPFPSTTNSNVVIAVFRSLPATIRLIVTDDHGASAERTVTVAKAP